jgi:hypothetical protein
MVRYHHQTPLKIAVVETAVLHSDWIFYNKKYL